MKAKLRSQAGESIAETLVSMLIVAVTFSFLAGAVVSAATVNAKLKGQDVTFQSAQEPEEEVTGYTIEVETSGGLSLTAPDTKLYRTENGYYYYEVQQEEPTEP